ncbi:DUF2461 domain-containing protein [Coralloluteibacterium stylophorae]|uniref:TIGR02453 family protein n=1 Tax=Coralloluteibacterium stylophorae TaxID=1776034 RepID=A0A8J7VTK2_9GAMM|nr:TIGR02453 family protein [Coralloluteibacterium stylophorae]MBS7455799.1 TIGR02453 family protein [Coralloluteibacterium stylophorae]
MTTYFTDKTFRFLRGLARNNDRTWFQAHKADYERHLREPMLQLITDLQPGLAAISPHFRADPRRVGGSLFRIQRDTRFANDKSPYKTWAAARLFHERAREVHAPGFYFHVDAGGGYAGGGLWQPDAPTLRRLRDFLLENPTAWTEATAGIGREAAWGGETLKRPPRGFPPEHPLIEDLKRKDFVASRRFDATVVLGEDLREEILAGVRATAPLVDYLCAALDLPF